MSLAARVLSLLLVWAAVAAGGRAPRLSLEPPQGHDRALLATLAAGSEAQCGCRCLWHGACAAVSYSAGQCRLLGCRPQWTARGHSCYRLAPELGSAEDGRSICRQLHPDALPTSVLSDEENQFLGQMIQNETEFVCFGFEHQPQWGSKEFRWMDGSEVTYVNWNTATGQPSGDTAYHFLTCWESDTLLWNDKKVSDLGLGLVCKI